MAIIASGTQACDVTGGGVKHYLGAAITAIGASQLKVNLVNAAYGDRFEVGYDDKALTGDTAAEVILGTLGKGLLVPLLPVVPGAIHVRYFIRQTAGTGRSVAWAIVDMSSGGGSSGARATFTATAGSVDNITAPAGTVIREGDFLEFTAGAGSPGGRSAAVVTIQGDSTVLCTFSVPLPTGQAPGAGTVVEITTGEPGIALVDVADAVADQADLTPFAANVKQVNSSTVTGDGSTGNPWRKA